MDKQEAKKAAIEFYEKETEIITNMSKDEKEAMRLAIGAAIVIGSIFAAMVFWLL